MISVLYYILVIRGTGSAPAYTGKRGRRSADRICVPVHGANITRKDRIEIWIVWEQVFIAYQGVAVIFYSHLPKTGVARKEGCVPSILYKLLDIVTHLFGPVLRVSDGDK